MTGEHVDDQVDSFWFFALFGRVGIPWDDEDCLFVIQCDSYFTTLCSSLRQPFLQQTGPSSVVFGLSRQIGMDSLSQTSNKSGLWLSMFPSIPSSCSTLASVYGGWGGSINGAWWYWLGASSIFKTGGILRYQNILISVYLFDRINKFVLCLCMYLGELWYKWMFFIPHAEEVTPQTPSARYRHCAINHHE